MQFEDVLTPTVHHPARRNTEPMITVDRLNLWYDTTHALKDVDFEIYPSEIVAFIGPSGCGKTTALKCLNRMHDHKRGIRIEGNIVMDGVNIHSAAIDPPLHRKRFGWVAQKPNPFATTVYENVAYGAKIHGLTRDKAGLEAYVERCLRRAELWDEVKDVMHTQLGTDLSGGQQQRLCIARALSTEPEVLLMDEPTGSIDPVATEKVEQLMIDLKADHSIVVVTHSMMQAKRVADRVAYFHLGRLLEIGPTDIVFDQATTPEARSFIAGKFG